MHNHQIKSLHAARRQKTVRDRVLQMRAQRAAAGGEHRIIQLNTVVEPTDEEVAQFSVGGGCGCGKSPCACPIPGPNTGSSTAGMASGYPAPCNTGGCGVYQWENCYDRWAASAGCRPAVLGASHTAVIDGQDTFEVITAPTNTEFFLPRKARIQVVDAQDPDVESRLFITAITINDIPQECGLNVENPNPATNVNEIWTDFYQNISQEGWPGVPVRWGPISTQARLRTLRIIGYSPFPIGELRLINVQLMGYCAEGLPTNPATGVPFWKCGMYPGDVAENEDADTIANYNGGCGSCTIPTLN